MADETKSPAKPVDADVTEAQASAAAPAIPTENQDGEPEAHPS